MKDRLEVFRTEFSDWIDKFIKDHPIDPEPSAGMKGLITHGAAFNLYHGARGGLVNIPAKEVYVYTPLLDKEPNLMVFDDLFVDEESNIRGLFDVVVVGGLRPIPIEILPMYGASLSIGLASDKPELPPDQVKGPKGPRTKWGKLK